MQKQLHFSRPRKMNQDSIGKKEPETDIMIEDHYAFSQFIFPTQKMCGGLVK